MGRVRDKIGILDLQGGVHEHVDHFRRVGVSASRIKRAGEFAELAGLVLPGGESTCLSRLMRLFGIDQALIAAHADGMKVWGSCAGAILVAREVVGEASHLGLLDISVRRNAFGSQLDSFHCQARVPRVAESPLELTFIRAPKIVRAGEGVEVLLRLDDYIAAAEDEQVLATVFHPELTPTTAFHRYFARKCGLPTAEPPPTVEPWTRTAWMRAGRAGHTAVG